MKAYGLTLIALVIVQGLMGWYMVKSGLVNNPEVSHYRLAAHLSLAFSVFGLAWWMMLSLRMGTPPARNPRAPLGETLGSWVPRTPLRPDCLRGFCLGNESGLWVQHFSDDGG